MLRVVADTNIYVSAFAFGGQIGKILEFAQEGRFELYISRFIISEIRRTFTKKFHWPPDKLAALISNVLRFTYLVEPTERIHVISRDPSDNHILECAVASYAHIIVTGDRHLQDLNHFENIEIISPRNFLDYLELRNGLI